MMDSPEETQKRRDDDGGGQSGDPVQPTSSSSSDIGSAELPDFARDLWHVPEEAFSRVEGQISALRGISDYVAARAEIEQKYSRDLLRAMRHTMGSIQKSHWMKTEESLVHSIDEFRKSLTKEAFGHHMLGQVLEANVMESLQRSKSDMTAMLKKFQTDFQKGQKQLANAASHTDKLQEKYFKLCLVAEIGLGDVEKCQASGTHERKQLTKMWAKVNGMIKDARESEQVYREAVSTQEDVNDTILTHRIGILQGLHAASVHTASAVHQGLLQIIDAITQCPRTYVGLMNTCHRHTKEADTLSDMRSFVVSRRSKEPPSLPAYFVPYPGKRPWVDEMRSRTQQKVVPISPEDSEAKRKSLQQKQDEEAAKENAEIEELEKKLSVHVEKVVSDEEPGSECIKILRNAMTHPLGRLAVLRKLNRLRADEKARALSDESFDMLVDLLLLGLSECHRSGDPRSGRLIMNMVQTFYRDGEDGEHEYMQVHVRNHDSWKDIRFWEGIFFDALQVEKERQGMSSHQWRELGHEEREERILNDQHVVFGQLGSYAFNMLSFGMDVEETKNFVEKMCSINELPQEYHEMILANIETTLQKLYPEDSEERQKLKKEEWRRAEKKRWERMRRMRKREHQRFEEEDPQSVLVNTDGDLMFDVEKSSKSTMSDGKHLKSGDDAENDENDEDGNGDVADEDGSSGNDDGDDERWAEGVPCESSGEIGVTDDESHSSTPIGERG
eukprot:TRINITY_DN2219_c0_g1_i1.p1 TRINITY_DN2219_c0_g1~~TRINITY_DN2219_c0_g1_i1.p1  ORF type:complete len:728 (-),score=248.97 TRINITY_DN2219_c0_g1_i1:103-2286(-)